MTKVLVLYYSAWGHMEQMAYAAAEGAKEAGAEVDVKRVPELVPEDVAKAAWYSLWARQALCGKVGSAMTSSATQHGGQESTILGFIPTMMHHGMVVVGLPYTWAGQSGVDEIRGGSPYGASTITHSDGSRQPAQHELDGARFQGRHVAGIAAKLAKA